MPRHHIPTKPIKTLIFSSLLSLFNHCLSQGSLRSTQSLHAHLIKTGLRNHTVLCNHLIHLYSKLGSLQSSLNCFSELSVKNTFSYNIALAAFTNSGRFQDARHLFDEMPERDTVTWNTIISMYASSGNTNDVFRHLYRMWVLGMQVSAYTLSIVASFLFSPFHAKELHGVATRTGFNYLNNVVHNSIISMYGRVGLVEYAARVFWDMQNRDLISWNSMLLVYKEAGMKDQAFECLQLMHENRFQVDGFTISTVLSICSDTKDLTLGESILALSLKLGINQNSVVAGSAIDLYCNCGRLNLAMRIFNDMLILDSILCDSMISGYTRFGLREEASNLFITALRNGVKVTEFTMANILNLISSFGFEETGFQMHSFVCKSGFESDPVVSSALVGIYSKMGLIDLATRIFEKAYFNRDLVTWNTIIMGLARNGRGKDALRVFKKMLKTNILPDRISFLGVLLACNNEGLVSEGVEVFTIMEAKYNVSCDFEHYISIVDLIGKAGRFCEAIDIINQMPYEANCAILGTLLEACWVQGKIDLAEIIAGEMVKLVTKAWLPYFILAQLHGIRGEWERVAGIWRLVAERGVKKDEDLSWICIKNRAYCFDFSEIFHYGGADTYKTMELLEWDLELDCQEIDYPIYL
ncbi:Pentatricopeptide repeat-containing family protein [Rhynchospora pubera]|uniref:Pentatricopeptide repeat-containing family protein n=1 Tax=Rhynchospora pubera TaxID=906938 RepID=A0AAV8E8Z8_9POAL|nr:Pentatricopeptide repeat-containing family protein [Rhynchospora pubera]